MRSDMSGLLIHCITTGDNNNNNKKLSPIVATDLARRINLSHGQQLIALVPHVCPL